MAAGVKTGDVVVTVPHTFIATTEAISQAGALPEFVDIDERTYNMDPEKLREYLESAVHRSDEGQLISKSSGRPVTRHCSCSSLWTNGGHGCDSRTGGHVSARSWWKMRARRMGLEYFSRKQNRWFTRGFDGSRRRIQLLSRGKSRSLRRRWCDYYERLDAWPTLAR